MEVKLRVADPAGNITIFVTSPVERNLYAKVANELLAIKEFRGEPVSYTHLTLPTICRLVSLKDMKMEAVTWK